MSDDETQESPPDQPDRLPVRMLNEYVYCPRLFYLEWVQKEWADNVYTEDGKAVHRRADRPTRPPPNPEEEAPFVARSVAADSERLGLSTRIDVIEGAEGCVTPIEYKRGRPAPVPARVHDPERVQVCAQALVLRDNGYTVDQAEVYFAESRERVPVELSDELVNMTYAALEGARALAAQDGPPPPLVDSPKCDGCSLVGICLPDEVNALHRAGPVPPDQPVRRLHPLRDDALPLYVQRAGTKLGVRGDVLQVREKGKVVSEARLEHTSQVSVFGGVQVSTQALRKLLQRDVPLGVFSAGGWFYGWARGMGSYNIELRRAQFRTADDTERALSLAQRFVCTKIMNQRTILRRNHPQASQQPVRRSLTRLNELREKASVAPSVASLLGIEGNAARIYYGLLPDLLKLDREALGELAPGGRSRRPPRDPFNALLSFTYALLTKEWTITCAMVGLDPLLGFYHRPRFGRPSLALDLMEEFRPIVADSVVLTVVNNGSIGLEDFTRRGLGVALKTGARKRLIAAYERRMDELVTHPVFGYRISYRRTLEVQARLLGRHLLGELPDYPEFRTR